MTLFYQKAKNLLSMSAELKKKKKKINPQVDAGSPLSGFGTGRWLCWSPGWLLLLPPGGGNRPCVHCPPASRNLTLHCSLERVKTMGQSPLWLVDKGKNYLFTYLLSAKVRELFCSWSCRVHSLAKHSFMF